MTTPRQTAYLEMLRVARELDDQRPNSLPGRVVEIDGPPRFHFHIHIPSLLIGALIAAAMAVLCLAAFLAGAA